MRIQTPIGWDNFTPLQKTEWWQENVVKPTREFQEFIRAKAKGGGKIPFPVIIREEKHPEKKDIKQQLLEVQAVFGKRLSKTGKRSTPKPKI